MRKITTVALFCVIFILVSTSKTYAAVQYVWSVRYVSSQAYLEITVNCDGAQKAVAVWYWRGEPVGDPIGSTAAYTCPGQWYIQNYMPADRTDSTTPWYLQVRARPNWMPISDASQDQIVAEYRWIPAQGDPVPYAFSVSPTPTPTPTPTPSATPTPTPTPGGAIAPPGWIDAQVIDNGAGYMVNVGWGEVAGADGYWVYTDGVRTAYVMGPGWAASIPYGATTPGTHTIAVTAVAPDGTESAPISTTVYFPPPGGGGSPSPTPTPTPSPTPSPGCNGCDWIRTALQCPYWAQYMSEFTNAVKNALPSLPEWRQIADQFVAAYAAYMGPVATPPTEAEIAGRIVPPSPTLSTAVPEAAIGPTMPPGYESPLVYDLTSGPQIAVTDESRPIEVYDPMQFISADPAGRPVYPGDSRNSSAGIKAPDRVDTGPAPTPRVLPGSSASPGPRPTAIPVPSVGPEPIPRPSDAGGVIPLPTRG